MLDLAIILEPEKHGYEECDHCNGYGSSLKDPEGVNKCTKCGGVGIVKKSDTKKLTFAKGAKRNEHKVQRLVGR